MSDLLAKRVRLADQVVIREFPAETVALHLRTGLYHGLNRTAGVMLEAVIGATSAIAVVAELSETLAAPPERVTADLAGLLESLMARDLVVAEDPAA